MKQLQERLKIYKQWASEPILPELTAIASKNTEKFANLLRLTWETEDTLRSFSPLAKGFLKPKQLVYATQGFLPQEREYISQFAEVLFEAYGDPLFRYTGFDNNVPKVRQFQALQRFSPKVTPGASKRRFDNLQAYFTEKTFKPDWIIFNKAVDWARKIMALPNVSVNFKPEYVRGLFAGHASNVGYPYYANELSKSDKQLYRDITVNLSTDLINKYKSCKWICSIPATIIGRDQPGGNTLDLTKHYTKDSLRKALKTIEYKPSKARPVWAVARVVNNIVGPVLKAVITNDEFKKNPAFCGFQSRESRFISLKRYDTLARKLNLIPVNVDFSAFDTSIPAELLLTALDLCFETVNLKDAPLDTLDAIKASAIFTHAIAIDPYTKRLFKKMKEACIGSGHGTTGFSGFSSALIAMLYAYIKLYGEEWVSSIYEEARRLNTAFSFGLGDDYLGLVKHLDDIQKIASIVKDAFGMEISTGSIKTSVGVDFLQELYWNNNIEYPIARLAPSALYTERSSGKGFAMWDMSFASMLYNIRTNPGAQLLDVTSIFQALDSTDLGLKNIDGKDITATQFMQYLKRECSLRDATAKQLLWDGDPAKETKFTDSGDLKSSYLTWWFGLIAAAKERHGRFSTDALRTSWMKFK